MSILSERDKEFISREMIEGNKEITLDMIKKATSNHITDHIDLAYNDICDRFRGIYKEGSNRRYSEKRTHTVSWFTNEDMFFQYCKSAFNSPEIRANISRWLKYWSKEDGYTREVRRNTNDPSLGLFVTRRGNWKKPSLCTQLVIVLQIESMGLRQNAGFSIKTAYPIPLDAELEEYEKNIRK